MYEFMLIFRPALKCFPCYEFSRFSVSEVWLNISPPMLCLLDAVHFCTEGTLPFRQNSARYSLALISGFRRHAAAALTCPPSLPLPPPPLSPPSPPHQSEDALRKALMFSGFQEAETAGALSDGAVAVRAALSGLTSSGRAMCCAR